MSSTVTREARNYITVGHENSSSIDIYYEDHGSGTGLPVVLIHSYPLSSTSWEKQTTALLGAGYRVIAYDRRGSGKSSQPAKGYDVDTFVEDLRKLILTLELRDVALVGASMGGGEVARYISKFGSDGIRRAVILSGVPPYLLKAPDNPDGVDKSVFDGIENAIAADRFEFFAEFLKDFYNSDVLGGTRISDHAVQAGWNVAVSMSPIAAYQCVHTWYTDFRKDLARINVPTLVMHGAADRIVPIAVSGMRTADMVKGAKFVEIKDGPHAVGWTHADIVNAELLRFLK